MRKRASSRTRPATEGLAESHDNLLHLLPKWVASEVVASPWAPKGADAEERSERGARAAESYARMAQKLDCDAMLLAELTVAHNLAMDLMARGDAAGEGSPWHALYIRDFGRMMAVVGRQTKLLLDVVPEADDESD